MSNSNLNSADQYFRYSASAFEIVVRLENADPAEYDPDNIRDQMDRYAALISLGTVHKEALEDIKALLKRYKGDENQYPEIKGYGIVGQFGDGKTHFLTKLNQLLRDESKIVYPEGMNLLTIDPFQFSPNPGDIVRALRERIRVELGPDAAGRIPDIAENDAEELAQKLRAMGVEEEEAEGALDDYTVMKNDGQQPGQALAEGIKETVRREKIDAIVLCIDEIEGIFRGEDPAYQDLDNYRAFFDAITPDVPVLIVMTAPRDQWAAFQDIHDGFISRAFGGEPRQCKRLRTLDEEELKNTWQQRRDNHLLREDITLPEPYTGHNTFPLHTATLRAINACAKRAESNRTAIQLMNSTFESFLEGDLEWVTPGDVFEAIDTSAFIDADEYGQIQKSDTDGLLVSIAGTLEQGVTHEELLDLFPLSNAELEAQIDDLDSQGWIQKRQQGDTLRYKLSTQTLNALLDTESTDRSGGEIKSTVETAMANTPTDNEVLYRNLTTILREDDTIDAEIVDAGLDGHCLTFEGNFGNFYDRRLVFATGNYPPERIEELRTEADAELVLTIDHGEYEYDSERVLSQSHEPWETKWEYEIEGLEYSLHNWVCGYTRLKEELSSGGHQLLRGIRRRIVSDALNIDYFALRGEIADRLQELYPHYPKPAGQINSNAKTTYINLLESGQVGSGLTWEDVKPQASAKRQQGIEGYFDDWEDFDFAVINRDQSPTTVDVQVSSSEELIIEQIESVGEDEESAAKKAIYNQMAKEGFKRDDVDLFLDILETRGKIRIEDSTVVLAQQSGYLASEFYKTIKPIAEWLTDDSLPQTFREAAIPNRDQIVAKSGACEQRYEEVQSGTSTEGISTVTRFVDEIEALRDECVKAIEQFDNSEFLQKVIKIQEDIETLKKKVPDDTRIASAYRIKEAQLAKTPKELANGAQRLLYDTLEPDTDAGNVFEELQALHDKYVDELAKIGLYHEYSTEAEFGECRTEFNDLRPELSEVQSAVDAVQQLTNGLSLADEIASIALKTRSNLLEFDEIESDAYDVDVTHELAEDARSVHEQLNEAEEDHLALADTIESISFQALDQEAIDNLRNAFDEADELMSKATREKEDLDDEIKSRAREINNRVSEDINSITEIASEEHKTTLSAIQYGEIRADALEWYSVYAGLVDEIRNRADDVRSRIPETVKDLMKVEQAYDDFRGEVQTVPEKRDDLQQIEQKYFSQAQDDIPAGLQETLAERRETSFTGPATKDILTLISQIGEITEAIDVHFAPLRERVTEMVEERGFVDAEILLTEVPQPELNESAADAATAANRLIREETLELDYNNAAVLRKSE